MAAAIGTSESFHHRYHPRVLGHTCQHAFGDIIRVRFEGMDRIGCNRQPVDVPAYALLLRCVSGDPLVQTSKGTAYITIQALGETCFTQGTDIEYGVGTQGHAEHIRTLADGHCLALSSSSTCERVLMRIRTLLSSIFEGDMSATSTSLRPYTITFSRYSRCSS